MIISINSFTPADNCIFLLCFQQHVLLENMETYLCSTEYNFSTQTQRKKAKLYICQIIKGWFVYIGGNNPFLFFDPPFLHFWVDQKFLCNSVKPTGISWQLCYALLWWWITAYISAMLISLTLQSSPCMCTEINWTLSRKGSVLMNRIGLRLPVLNFAFWHHLLSWFCKWETLYFFLWLSDLDTEYFIGHVIP